MSIFVDENTKVVVQGLTGGQGRFHGLRNRAYGTKVVAGTSPNKAGTDVEGIPVYASVAERSTPPGPTPLRGGPAACGVCGDPRGGRGGRLVHRVLTEGIPAQDEALTFNRLRTEFPGTGCSVRTALHHLPGRRTSASPRGTSPSPADPWASSRARAP